MWQLEPLSQRATQFEILAALGPEVKHYLEVGVQEGRSLQVILDHSMNLHSITLCDTWGSESGGSGRGTNDHIIPVIVKRFGSYFNNEQVRILDGDSRDLLPTLLPLKSCHFDLVHIDGGHSYDVVVKDLWNGWKLCRRFMVVHDTSFVDVWRALYGFLNAVDDFEKVDMYFGGHGTAVIRRY